VVNPSTQVQRITFVPLDPDHPGSLAAYGQKWRAAKERLCCHSRNQLVKAIATQISIPNGFVFFHVDGDTTWANRQASVVTRVFDEIMRHAVGAFLAMQGLGAREIDIRLSRLFLILPFYSIESWLYQNTDHAVLLCHKHYGGRDVARFEEWGADRTMLDEVSMPKCEVCLGSGHNEVLASNAFPAEAVYGAGKSFAETVTRLQGSHEFSAALERTYAL
jgi:hypothetical protein